jgi:muramoyltetrapeptide carboxypeptidase LdcA involved in peptidoglycan recycling
MAPIYAARDSSARFLVALFAVAELASDEDYVAMARRSAARADPKFVVGFSDIANLHLILWR